MDKAIDYCRKKTLEQSKHVSEEAEQIRETVEFERRISVQEEIDMVKKHFTLCQAESGKR